MTADGCEQAGAEYVEVIGGLAGRGRGAPEHREGQQHGQRQVQPEDGPPAGEFGEDPTE
jgi:hypothetical protein